MDWFLPGGRGGESSSSTSTSAPPSENPPAANSSAAAVPSASASSSSSSSSEAEPAATAAAPPLAAAAAAAASTAAAQNIGVLGRAQPQPSSHPPVPSRTVGFSLLAFADSEPEPATITTSAALRTFRGGGGGGRGGVDESDDDQEEDRKPAAKPATTNAPSSLSSASLSSASSDRRKWLDALRGSGATHGNSQAFWTSLPDPYRTDKEFVLTALRHFAALPDKSSFERSFPQPLRFDRDVVLAFCARADFPALYERRHLYPPHCLTSDKDVMLAYCRAIPRSLQECSEELADDPDVVRAAVNLDGLELQYASRRLQEDLDTVRAACAGDGRALEFCPPGPLREQLCQDREFMMGVMRNRGGALWRMAAPALQDDKDLLREALVHGLRLRFCPSQYRDDADFLCSVLERNSAVYLEMTRPEQVQQSIAVSAIISPTSKPEVHERALQLVPGILTNRDVVLAIAQRGNSTVVSKIFLEANDRMQDDKDIVLAVLKKNVGLFANVSANLKRDNDVLVAAMDANTALTILKTISPAVQEECPQIPEHAIRVASAGTLRELRRYVQPAALWADKRIAMAWVQRGQPTLMTFAPFFDDEDFALAVAQHVPHDFVRVGTGLRSSKDFMLQALALNGRVLRYAGTALQSDYSLVVRAVATSPDALWPGCPVTSGQLLTYLNDKLKLHNIFVMDFLRGIAISDSQRLAPSRRSALPLLDRGVETSQAFKRLIAELLGVPLGKELAEIRVAHHNLSTAPVPTSAATAAAERAAAHAGDAINMDLGDPWMFDGPAGDRVRARRAMLFQRMLDADGFDDMMPPAVAAANAPNAGEGNAARAALRGRDPFMRRVRWGAGRDVPHRGGAADNVRAPGRADPAGAAAAAAAAAPGGAAAAARNRDFFAIPLPRANEVRRRLDRPGPRRAQFLARRLQRDAEVDMGAPVADLRRARIADPLVVEDQILMEEIMLEDLLMGDEMERMEEEMFFAAMEVHDRLEDDDDEDAF